MCELVLPSSGSVQDFLGRFNEFFSPALSSKVICLLLPFSSWGSEEDCLFLLDTSGIDVVPTWSSLTAHHWRRQLLSQTTCYCSMRGKAQNLFPCMMTPYKWEMGVSPCVIFYHWTWEQVSAEGREHHPDLPTLVELKYVFCA